MSLGIPVDSKKAGSIPEIYGDASEFVATYNVEELADALNNFP